MKHSEREHALLSASSAERWLNCPPSARLEEDIPDEETKYSKEGSLAHEFAELLLKYRLKMITLEDFERTKNDLVKHKLFKAEMLQYVERYVEYVELKYFESLARDRCAKIIVEEKLDYSAYVPQGFGTGDCVIKDNEKITIIDFKYGKGREVSAEDNPQMKLYAAGALLDPLYEPATVELCIFQPRVKLEPEEWRLSIDDLNNWLSRITPIAKLAHQGGGEFKCGSWCRFCRAKATCAKRKNTYFPIYEEAAKVDVSLLSNEDILSLLPYLDSIATWADDVKSFALDQALKGVVFEGYKIVEGKSKRSYIDEEKVASKLEEFGFDSEQYSKRKLIAISDLQRLIGKDLFKDHIMEFIFKPIGKPTLVPNSHKSPPMNINLLNEFEDLGDQPKEE